MHHLFEVLLKIWNAPGVREFLSVLLGGGVTMGAQFLALKHDREKEAIRRADEQKACAWAIYFKISEVHEALTAAAKDIRSHRETALARGEELWQVLQFPVHDWNTVAWDVTELVLLIDHKMFDLMTRYQQATWWLSNLVQSTKLYREIRVELLTKTPSQVDGGQGVIEVGPDNQAMIMPVVAHLRSLSHSLEAVVLQQAPDARKLLIDYAKAMKALVGRSPKIQFLDQDDGQMKPDST